MPREKPKAKRPPDFDVFVVEGDDEEGREQKGFWTKIGGAWSHGDEAGYSIVLAALPLNGRLVLGKPKPPEAEGANAARK
jgi:hypothetical protein